MIKIIKFSENIKMSPLTHEEVEQAKMIVWYISPYESFTCDAEKQVDKLGRELRNRWPDIYAKSVIYWGKAAFEVKLLNEDEARLLQGKLLSMLGEFEPPTLERFLDAMDKQELTGLMADIRKRLGQTGNSGGGGNGNNNKSKKVA